MSPERWQQIEAIFQTAVDLKAADRAAFIEKACAGDTELKAEVAKLAPAPADPAEAPGGH